MALKFLQEVAAFISSKYKGNYKDLVIIVPNRRAGLFLEKYLLSVTNKTTWAPRFFSIEDYIFEVLGFTKASSTDLVFELYEIYLKQNPVEKQSFDDFSNWGPRLINDFNDIDSYLSDFEVVFNFLSEARNLQKWNLDRPQLTEIESNYLKFYGQLKTYYLEFKAKLKKNSTAYPGMAIRMLVTDIKQYKMLGENFVIAGFNALSKAEEKLFKYLVSEYKAQIFWDVDNHYLTDFKQEAGKQIRKNLNDEQLKGNVIISNGFNTKKSISVNGVSGNYGMIKYAGKILEDLMSSKDFNPNDTAIILPDPDILFALLNSLPKNIKEMNITMSFPYKKSEAYDLIIRIIDLYDSASRINKSYSNSNTILLHHKALQKLINSPLFKQAYGQSLQRFIYKIKSENLNLITFNEAENIANQAGIKEDNPWAVLKTDSLDAISILNKISLFLELIQKNYSIESLSKELLILNHNIIKQLLQKVENHNVIQNLSTLKKLFKTLTSIKGIPFEGKPLAGLQIMGVLETRALDFKNIIYLSFNEGIFPQSSQFKSFILPEIRREYGLPMPLDDDAIMAYHFYRSIQKAENVTLIYNTISGKFGGGEMSRFAMQLTYELKKNHPEITLKENAINLPTPLQQQPSPIIIEKTQDIMDNLLLLGTASDKGFSPTSLTTYIACSLKFYFSKILKIKAQEEIEEELAVNTRGSAIHGTLEILYENEIKGLNKFDKEFYQRSLENYSSILDAQYKKYFKKGDTDHGYNLLFKTLDNKMIHNFLTAEIQNSMGITEVKCEEKLEHFFPLKSDGNTIKIRIHGLADRIDLHHGLRRIIDYKTGKVKSSDLNLDKGRSKEDKWENMFLKNSHPKAFQLLTYALIYNRMNGVNTPIIPIIAGLKAKDIYFHLKINESDIINEDILNTFEDDLLLLIQKIYDREIPFSQTEDLKTCKYCDYKTICNRDG